MALLKTRLEKPAAPTFKAQSSLRTPKVFPSRKLFCHNIILPKSHPHRFTTEDSEEARRNLD
jgi:hypothetical protein